MVERGRKPRDAHGDELGGCHRVCFSGCVFRQYLFFPKLYDSIVFARKVAFGGRLLVREQDELRAAQAADAFVHAAYTAYDASCGGQVVCRVAAVGLRACPGRAGTVERHCGVQLSGGRYGDREPGIPKHGFLCHRIRHRRSAIYATTWRLSAFGFAHPAATARLLCRALCYGTSIHRPESPSVRRSDVASGRPAGELCETLCGTARTDASD